MNMQVEGKVALVTGAAIGIGYEIARELLRKGALGVVLSDVNAEAGQNAVEKLSKQYEGNRITFIKSDVTNEKEFKDAFEKAISTFGKINVLVNNAGIMNDLNYEQEIDINLTGVVRGILLGQKYLGKGGLILNICSTTAGELFQCLPIYSSTKAGVLNLTRGFGHPFHFERTGVAVIALCPGKTETALQATNLLLEGCQDELIKIVAGQEIQMPDAVGRAAIYAMQNGKSGSIWMIDQNNLFTVDLPAWESCREIVIKGI